MKYYIPDDENIQYRKRTTIEFNGDLYKLSTEIAYNIETKYKTTAKSTKKHLEILISVI